MTAKTRNLLLAFAALGLGASTWSSYVHYALLTRPGYSSVCDINSTVSCTQAYLSQYGSLWGVPVALAGVLFFALVLLIVGFGGRSGVASRENVPAYIFVLSTVGLAVVLYLAWASFFKLNAVCLLCAATYVAVIGIFVVSGGATSFSIAKLPGRASKDVMTLLKSPVALIVAIVFSVGFVGLVNVFPREAHAQATQGSEPAYQYPPLTDQQKKQMIDWWDVQPKSDLGIDPGGAKVVIVKFNDFQCPACMDTYRAYKGLLQKYTATGRVKYVVKHYPLEPECNGAVPGGNHRAACEAAAAMVMARSKGTAEKVEDWLFANQASLTPDFVKRGVAGAGGVPDFDARYAEALTEVRADAALGERVAIKSTPTFFINGRKFEGGIPPPALEFLIEHELKQTP
jgi:uncharacterized membrane protein/protein-disulfide isomerase